MPSNKRLSILMVSLLVALGFCSGYRLLHADDNIIFPNCLRDKNCNIEQSAHHVFQIVANKMGIEIVDTVPKPIILTDEQITLNEYNSYMGWNSIKVLPYYFSKQNILVIPKKRGLDSLAHELVHYFQFMYRNGDFNSDSGLYTECLEMEAVVIERWFKSRYLNPENWTASVP